MIGKPFGWRASYLSFKSLRPLKHSNTLRGEADRPLFPSVPRQIEAGDLQFLEVHKMIQPQGLLTKNSDALGVWSLSDYPASPK